MKLTVQTDDVAATIKAQINANENRAEQFGIERAALALSDLFRDTPGFARIRFLNLCGVDAR